MLWARCSFISLSLILVLFLFLFGAIGLVIGVAFCHGYGGIIAVCGLGVF